MPPRTQAVYGLPRSNGAGALVFLEAHTASASASLDFTGCVTSTYDEYQIEFINVLPATDAASLRLRCSTNGGSSYDSGSNYSYSGIRFNSYGSAVEQSDSAAFILVDGQGGGAPGVDNSATLGGLSGHLRVINPLGATAYKHFAGQVALFSSAGSATYSPAVVNGAYKSATAVNAFQFLFSSGNITSGTIRVYGIAK